jgi:hypothetical protein
MELIELAQDTCCGASSCVHKNKASRFVTGEEFYVLCQYQFLWMSVQVVSREKISKTVLPWMYDNMTYILFTAYATRVSHNPHRILFYLASHPLGQYKHLPHSVSDRTLG